MSNVCCKEFRGWIRSFTSIERVLAILEAILLVLFVVLLILMILHLLACSQPSTESRYVTSSVPSRSQHTHREPTSQSTEYIHEITIQTSTGSNSWSKSLISSKVCSWTPSVQTEAISHHYEHDETPENIPASLHTGRAVASTHNITSLNNKYTTIQHEVEEDGDHEYTDKSMLLDDDEAAEDEYKTRVVALVKLKPPKDVTFGCIMSIVSKRWALTAASCIEAIEEVDSLDSFVFMEHHESGDTGPPNSISDVQIHPLYAGRNRSYDLAALQSSHSLLRGAPGPLRLASMLDFLLSTVGDTYTILRYAPITSTARRSLRQARVQRVGAHACAAAARGGGGGGARGGGGGGGGGGARGGGGGGAGAVQLRHLQAGRAAAAARCGAAPLCAARRGRRCDYCAGTPLLQRGRLLALMADNPHCALSCEPALYVNVAELAGWIRSVVTDSYLTDDSDY